MPRHFGLPISQILPRSAVPNLVGRTQQGAGVGDGSTANSAAVQNGDMAEKPHAEEAAQGQIWPPEPAIQRPAGEREIFWCPSAAHFHHCNAVALFGEAEGADAATESGADNDEVEIVMVRALGQGGFQLRLHLMNLVAGGARLQACMDDGSSSARFSA
jgi:hypothetical protein